MATYKIKPTENSKTYINPNYVPIKGPQVFNAWRQVVAMGMDDPKVIRFIEEGGSLDVVLTCQQTGITRLFVILDDPEPFYSDTRTNWVEERRRLVIEKIAELAKKAMK